VGREPAGELMLIVVCFQNNKLIPDHLILKKKISRNVNEFSIRRVQQQQEVRNGERNRN